VKLPIPLLFDLYTNPQEITGKVITDSWVIGPALKMIAEFEATQRNIH
jgi:arylsulfatase